MNDKIPSAAIILGLVFAAAAVTNFYGLRLSDAISRPQLFAQNVLSGYTYNKYAQIPSIWELLFGEQAGGLMTALVIGFSVFVVTLLIGILIKRALSRRAYPYPPPPYYYYPPPPSR